MVWGHLPTALKPIKHLRENPQSFDEKISYKFNITTEKIGKIILFEY